MAIRTIPLDYGNIPQAMLTFNQVYISPFFLVLLFYSHSFGMKSCEENETVDASPTSEYTIEKFTDHRSSNK